MSFMLICVFSDAEVSLNITEFALHAFHSPWLGWWLDQTEPAVRWVEQFVPAVGKTFAAMIHSRYSDRIPFVRNVIGLNWLLELIFLPLLVLVPAIEGYRARHSLRSVIENSIERERKSKAAHSFLRRAMSGRWGFLVFMFGALALQLWSTFDGYIFHGSGYRRMDASDFGLFYICVFFWSEPMLAMTVALGIFRAIYYPPSPHDGPVR